MSGLEIAASAELVLPKAVSGRVLRFHPRCAYRNDADEPVTIPALIALFRDILTDEPKAILRRGLTPDGGKFGAKPLYLGPMAGCAIKLTANEDVCQGLHVAEGVETAIAAMMLGFTPMWALGGTGNLKTLPVLAGIDALTIVVDHDVNGAGHIAASDCFDRWTAAGREVWSIIPHDVGADLNDVITSMSAA
jgi:putative DNA primase/helicase